MYLDLNEQELSFDINDIKFGKDLDVAVGEYRAVVSIEQGDEPQEIELLSYS